MRVKTKNLSLRQLRAFAAVARLRSFVAASKELFLTQSALSETVRQLEEVVGVKLLDRTTRSVHLTMAGDEFLQEITQVLRSLDSAVRRMDEVGSVKRGLVRVAGATSVHACVVAPCLGKLLMSHPDIRFEIAEDGSEDIVKRVLEGSVDFGVGALSKDALRGLHAIPLLLDFYGVVAARDHPIFSAKTLTLAGLASWNYVGFSVDTRMGAFMRTLANPPKPIIDPRVTVDGTGSLISLLENGVGVSILPALAMHQLITPKLEFRMFARPAHTRRVAMVRRKGRSLSPAAQLLWDAMLSIGAELPEKEGVQFASPIG